MRAAAEFSEAVSDSQRLIEWLGASPRGLSLEIWADMGSSLMFRVVRAGRGKKYDRADPTNVQRSVEAPPDKHGGLIVRDLKAKKVIWSHALSWPAQLTYVMARVAISQDGRVVALGDLDLDAWDVIDDRALMHVGEGKERAGAITDLAVSPYGGAVAVGRKAGGLELWNTRNGIRTRLVRGPVFEAFTWTGPFTLVAAANTQVRWIDFSTDLSG
jgi:hypothetical protein